MGAGELREVRVLGGLGVLVGVAVTPVEGPQEAQAWAGRVLVANLVRGEVPVTGGRQEEWGT